MKRCVATAYKYENLECGTAMLYRLDNKISWQQRSGASEWHGHFEDRLPGEIHLLFSHNPSECPLTTTRLFKTDEKRWQGWDYKGRAIVLTLVGELEYDYVRGCWNMRS
jgi:hypothetical protein